MTPTREETLQAELEALKASIPDVARKARADALSTANKAMGWLIQNAPTAAQAVLEALVLGTPMPPEETLQGFARGDWARASEEGKRLSLNKRLREMRDMTLDEAASVCALRKEEMATNAKGWVGPNTAHAYTVASLEAGLCADAIRALKSKEAE